MSDIKDTVTLKFETVNYWNNPIFKVMECKSLYVGSIDVLFPNTEIAPNGTPEEITKYFKNNTDKLVVFGSDLDDDPLGTTIKKSLRIKFI